VFARNLIVSALGAAALLAGCGDDGGEKKSATGSAASAPAAKEPLAAAAARLQRAVATGDCKALAPLMLHSAKRGTEPATPPTAAECRTIEGEARGDLRGFRLTTAREFGPAGLTQGSAADPRAGQVLGIVWALDRDGSWKVLFDAAFRPQLGQPFAYGAHGAANAEAFVAAVRKQDCEGIWRYLNVASRFVRGSGGDRARFCAGLRPVYRDKRSAYAQIAADGEAHPQEIGKARDLAFYSLRLRNGRYLVLVMAGRFGLEGVALSEQTEHGNPSVLDFVTVRRPAGQ
jgi:hypothetical protein